MKYLRLKAVPYLAVFAAACLLLPDMASAGPLRRLFGGCGHAEKSAGDTGPVRATLRGGGKLVGGLLSRTRFFDGDGRPFRRAN